MDTQKTDLQKILSISGEQGLWNYVSNMKNGLIAESLADKTRKPFGAQARVTALSDISIYTESGELSLKDVFLKMKEQLADKEAPCQKSDAKTLTSFFKKAIPDYDEDRFYNSHMKKVAQWYNIIRQHASFDFVNPEEKKEEAEQFSSKAEAVAESKPKAKAKTKGTTKN